MCLEDGKVLEVVLPGREQMTYLGGGKVCLGNQGEGGSYTDEL